MKKRNLFRSTALLLVLCMLAGLCGCMRKPKAYRPSLEMELSGQENSFTFSAQESQTLSLSAEGAAQILSAVDAQTADYFLSELYALEEVKKRLDFDASVEAHQFSALNEAGVLDAGHLTELVKHNNAAFLAGKPFGYEAVEEDYIAELCAFIVQVIDAMRQKYPDIDWERVYCNLGNLKILYDVGSLNYAQVTQDWVLGISKTNTQIVQTLKGEDGFSRVLTHEIMHIIQLGCPCEHIEHCSRRAGIALYWDDFFLNTADWSWMVEGSAERNMCTLTGGEALTYQFKMDYLCSMTMSVLLRDSVQADTLDTLCFYSDPELLFDAFGCETQEQRDELLNLMITMQVLQMSPAPFYQVYKESTGVDLRADEDVENQFFYSLKPAVCVSLAKEFYQNLVPFLQEHECSLNDLFFLLNLFEGHLNQHLRYANESNAELNQPFFSSYNAMRSALFSALEADNPGLELAALYGAYNITAAGEELLNAELAMLPAEKRDFLAERAQWQAEQLALGVKVPQ